MYSLQKPLYPPNSKWKDSAPYFREQLFYHTAVSFLLQKHQNAVWALKDKRFYLNKQTMKFTYSICSHKLIAAMTMWLSSHNKQVLRMRLVSIFLHSNPQNTQPVLISPF